MKHLFSITSDYINDEFKALQAQPEDTEDVMSLLMETAEWLRSQGSSQWNALLKGEDSHHTAEAIQRGDVFVFKKGSDVAGMVILMSHPSAWDVHLWGSKAHAGDGALYLHRLAIRRKYAQSGLGRAILQWSSSGIQFEDKHIVRLDCGADNATLNAFYTRNGYTFVGETDGYSTYEKAVTHRSV
ncbi:MULTISPECIES: GNAT family N-acetyltransferase [Paenibacillus]|uniref:Ribosomal protein S18 acetylase RimI-like enzyme n=1 Tax=Paenibacillus pabuli TaxID=1472 RepID=A0A855XQK0_9BACL|nr:MULTISPECIES: GNAT family N-acetyltransferase [Paenibacillus]PWW33155.1 ribosomal protein S18 acetylase RimI-like enzyme [Paenibacillus pabuli]PXV99245.1 ribosomal protein S18 acetylase RimI-like enzyme [Paenibacillus taichungensis]